MFFSALAAVTIAANACGGSVNSNSASSSTPSAALTTTTVTTTTSVAPQTDFERWAAAYEPYADSASDLNQRVFDFQMGLCTELRAGGTEAIGVYAPQGPAELLREGWGVGVTAESDPLYEKGQVAEKVIIPILCPDQEKWIADAKAGRYTKQKDTGFYNGKHLVRDGTDGSVAPGTYSVGPVSDCYWERSDSQGNIIDNNFVSISRKITVTIEPSDGGFTSTNCGKWELEQ